MLPFVSHLPRNLIAGTVALAIAATSAPAFAWGQREQDFTKGVAATLLLGALIRQNDDKPNYRTYRGPVYYQPAPVYQPVYPQPAYPSQSIYSTPAAIAFNSYTRNERIRIQATLANRGYYNGALDGSFGPGTYAAITAYAQRSGHPGALATRTGAFGLYDGLIS